MAIPAAAAAFAHWYFRCSVGVTIVTRSTTRSASSSLATRNPNTVLPAPGVATASKSCGLLVRYFVMARRCHALSGREPPGRTACSVPCTAVIRPATPSLDALLAQRSPQRASWRAGSTLPGRPGEGATRHLHHESEGLSSQETPDRPCLAVR